MNTLRSTLVGLSVAGLLVSASAAFAQSTWTGSVDTNWSTAGNWSPSGVPNVAGGVAAVINSGTVTYGPGGDFTLGGGGSLTLNGGSFTQSTGGMWMNIGNSAGSGSLIIAGGTFSAGTSPNLRIGFDGGLGIVSVTSGAFNPNEVNISATGQVSISGGVTTISNAFNNSGTFTVAGGGTVNFGGNFTATSGEVLVSGGTINVTGELKPQNNDFTVSGGVINASLISFDAVNAKFNFSGGVINLSGNFTDGIFANGTAYVNFTESSTAQLHLASVSTTAAANLLSGRVRIGDAIDADAFEILSDGGAGSIISLVGAPIPEPSAFAALAGVAALGLVATRRRRTS